MGVRSLSLLRHRKNCQDACRKALSDPHSRASTILPSPKVLQRTAPTRVSHPRPFCRSVWCRTSIARSPRGSLVNSGAEHVGGRDSSAGESDQVVGLLTLSPPTHVDHQNRSFCCQTSVARPPRGSLVNPGAGRVGGRDSSAGKEGPRVLFLSPPSDSNREPHTLTRTPFCLVLNIHCPSSPRQLNELRKDTADRDSSADAAGKG